MSDVDVAALRKMIDETITQWAAGVAAPVASPTNELTEVVDERILPEGKRVVRTKSSGDRVYYIDETNGTRQWVTNPDVLAGLGFEIEDVTEVEDSELLKYNMGPALYKAPDAEPKA